ncbi:Telo_bind domain-containing protein [Caenorhabditis elegans]|uniref:Telo_bind domain-containing protein n=1 Tax=Caenorhabditis elegans TaxID=6239 RepID=O44155_CAEEL|nr:Telo_bind domain-containing protein [Caenorhabditis elegans]CCD67620.1 Telo_bind domain-containing protein [Caenorhabditis elegans]|eukprot:NP_500938.1 Uncharacterized protein CELE_C49A9.1 [Caenorhabditis elegans]
MTFLLKSCSTFFEKFCCCCKKYESEWNTQLESISLFAARRGFTDGEPYLILFGLCPNANKTFIVSENKLSDSNICLGDFLVACSDSPKNLKNFKKVPYPLDVTVEGDYAIISYSSMEAIKDISGILIFQTTDFGPIRSLNQNLDLDEYNITVHATGVSASGHVIELRAKAQPASNYRNSSVYENPSFLDDLSDEPLEIKKTISNNSLDGFSMEQLIQQLPTLELGEAENSVRVPQNLSAPRLMKAFVYSVHQYPHTKFHFLWICDIMEKSILKLPQYDFELGYFFEGIFKQKSNGKWECEQYNNKIEPLINGTVVINEYNGNEKVELTTTVTNYKPKNNTRKWPEVEAKYLGVVYDRHNKLPKNCEGQKVEVQMMKIDKEQYGWVITDILNE